MGNGNTVSHTEGNGFANLCNYKAKVWSTRANGQAYSVTSGTYWGCSLAAASRRADYPGVTLKANTGIYGQFYHDGAWAPGAPELIVY